MSRNKTTVSDIKNFITNTDGKTKQHLIDFLCELDNGRFVVPTDVEEELKLDFFLEHNEAIKLVDLERIVNAK